MKLPFSKITFYKIEWLFLIISLLITSLIIKQFPDASEMWMLTVAKALCITTSALNKYIPFSITEIIFFLCIIYAIFILVSFIVRLASKKKTNIIAHLLNAGLIASIIFTSFIATAGVGYSRGQVDIPQYGEDVDYTKYKQIVYSFLDDYNYCASMLDFDEDTGEVINPYSHAQMNVLIEKEYSKLDSDYFFSLTSYTKPMMSSFLYREFQITGLTLMPFGEANYDYMIPNSEIPFTIAHELAHQKGVSREEDAQLTALYITLNSDIPYIRYSGYVYSLSSLLILLNFIGDSNAYSAALQYINGDARKDSYYNTRYWSEHNLLANFSRWWNNLFLKFNGQSNGIQSYNDEPDIDNEGTEEDPIYVLKEYSPYQKLYFYFYFE